MDMKTQGAPGYYVWEVPEKSVAVHLHLDVVDRLLADVMRGFGAVPKRGAEVGGVLIGTIRGSNPSIVRVEDFELVDCTYKRGPSFLLTDQDSAAFEEACERWRADGSRPAYAVGFFRSHTREGLSLAPEDLDLLDRNFPSPAHLALLVKPYGTKVSAAGFLFRENGAFQESTPLEFPFRRRELAGEEAPPRRPMNERRPREREFLAINPTVATPEPDLPAEIAAPSKSKLRVRWVWIPLSFVFLLLGVLLGFQAAQTMGSKASAESTENFSLGLSIAKADDNLSVKWDRQAAGIRSSQRGVLEIEDGSYTKSVDLDSAQLQNGSIIYRNSSNIVRFRLVVYPKARLSVTETMEWKR